MQIRYSIPEEMKRGVFIGDVAKDLGLDINRLSSGQAHLLSDNNRQHIELNRDKGYLVVKERMDREQFRGQKSPCSFSLELVLENPLELCAITVEVEDINDNAPVFSEKEIRLDFSESAPVGTHFLLGSATDPDMPLDREEKSEHILKLTAVDGGTPQMSDTVQIHVTGLDANDNAPVFEEALYRSSLIENKPEGTLVGRVKVTVADEGFNSNITYILTHVDDSVRPMFHLNSSTGEIILKGEIDHEKKRQYEINIQAKDLCGLTGSSKLVLEILDMNDNTPIITMTSFSGKIPEYSKPGTTAELITLFTCTVNAQVRYSIQEEMEKGSLIGDISKDLGIDVRRLKAGRARIVSEDNSACVELDVDKGLLLMKKRIDREELCGQTVPCSFGLEMVLENPMELFSITVEILDINDNTPSFPTKEITLNISEGAPLGAHFILSSALDRDVGINGLQRYTLKPTTHFNLKEQTHADGSKYVEMVLQSPLDREKQAQMFLTLTAADGGNPQRTGSVNILINILDANDNAPVFTQAVYKATVVENAAKGTLVATVSAIDADEGVNSQVTYYIDSLTQQNTGVFSMNEGNGEIRVRGLIDYEKNKHFQINVIAKDLGGLSKSCKVIIDVLDLNDNAPLITLTSFSNTISEDSLPGTTVAIINVKDLDSEKNGKVNCTIDQSLPFQIKLSLTNYYTLTTERTLDREIISEYNITLTATDHGVPPLRNSKTLHVGITDVNDNAPVFDQSVYVTSISENNTPGVSIASVHANDADWNQNARISYFLDLTQVSETPASSMISVNSETGDIYAVRSFDFEEMKYFECRIKAQDGGSPPLSGSVTVKINILDQNDNAPQVLYPIRTGGSLVAEMVPLLALAVVSFLFISSLLTIISVKIYRWKQSRIYCNSNLPVIPYYPPCYADAGGTGTLRHMYNYEVCMTTDSRKSDIKYLRPCSQSLVNVEETGMDTMQPLQKNPSNEEYSKPTGTEIKWIVLHAIVWLCAMKEVNSQARYSIPEELAVGSIVGNIATDLALEVKRLVSGNARIVTKGNRQYVELNKDKGVLEVRERIDREDLCKRMTPCSFSFDIIIENPIQLYRVAVEVRDINDNAPIFPRDDINIEVSESAATGARFALESAVDQDVGVNGIQSYSLKPNDNFKLELQGHPDGSKYVEMVLQTPLDREKQEDLSLLLVAIDGGDPQKSGAVRIHVTVLDANDNAPVCGQTTYKVEVKENSPKETLITTISANDADKGPYGDVSFSIGLSSEEANGLFKINAQTGEIRLSDKLDYEKTSNYHLNIKAKDQGGLTDTCKVIIQVIDENDNIPTISLMSFSKSVPEDSPIGTTVAVMNADDLDSGKNGALHCHINPDVPFKVESSYSDYYTLVTDGLLDRETTPKYNVTITISDEGIPPLSRNLTVTIVVSDVNDNAPLFERQFYETFLKENNLPNVDVLTVKASDADSGNNCHVTYFLEDTQISGTSVSSFVSVDSSSGVISAARSFDFEQIKSFSFNVTAQDGGSPPRKTRVTVRIAIQDQNDNAPQILYPVQTGFPEVLSEFSDFTHNNDYNDSLTFYLVLALAVVSFLFISSLVVIISVKIYRWRQSRIYYQSNLPVIPYYPPHYADAEGTGTLQHVYNYEVCMTTDSRKSDCKFVRPCSQSVLLVDQRAADVMDHDQNLKNILEKTDSLDQIRYSIPEEMNTGSPVGNFADDLGLELTRLRVGRARIVTEENIQYIDLKTDKGILVVNERIDREGLCGEISPCSFSLEIILENPLELHHVTIEILDVNDHTPTFQKKEIKLEISESAAIGSRFLLGSAEDPDVGVNALQNYILYPTENFILKQHSRPDGVKYAEMVLQKPLDREEHPHLSLTLTAVDGGNPQRSGTVIIDVTVLDVNDNAPVFNQTVYRATVMENAPKGTHITTVNATDADSGSNGLILYSFANLKGNIAEMFYLDVNTGAISVAGEIDFEKTKKCEISIEAKDQGGLGDSSKVIVEVIDVNDNAP
ncbi:protocadherin Fat 4-like, partial [Scleropages formosus]